jgi:hypothetical protein
VRRAGAKIPDPAQVNGYCPSVTVQLRERETALQANSVVKSAFISLHQSSEQKARLMRPGRFGRRRARNLVPRMSLCCRQVVGHSTFGRSAPDGIFREPGAATPSPLVKPLIAYGRLSVTSCRASTTSPA